MSRLFLTPIDLNQLELRQAVIQVLSSDPGSPATGQIWFNSTSHTLKFYNGTTTIVLGTLDQVTTAAADVNVNSHKLINVTDPSGPQDAATKNYIDTRTLNQLVAPTADLSINSHKLTNVTDPASAQDAATKAYVDAVQVGITWKASVRAATTANGTLATAYANGQVIDGVTLATGDRILIKNQTTGGENGIYVVAASGAPARAADSTTAAQMLQEAVFVREGTANADTGWVATANAITVGTTDPAYVQFTGAASVLAGNGLTKVGNTISVVPGAGILADGTSTRVDTSVVTRKYAVDVGDNSSTAITVTHSLGTLDVETQVYRKSDGVVVECDVTNASTTTVTLTFATAPTTAQYRAVIHA